VFRNTTLLLIITLVLVSTVSLSMFTVYETDKAILVRLGELVLNSHDNKPKIIDPGLHFKIPFIDEVRNFDTRLSMLEIKSSRIFTVEKKGVLVDFFVQWRIKDLALFYTRTNGIRSNAEALLKQKVISGLRAEFGKRTIREVVSEERGELMNRLRNSTDRDVEHLGINVIDVRVKRIDLPDEVSGSVYDRMRSEREREASEIRSEGRAGAINKRAEADKERRILLAEAQRDAKRIKGEGDAKAIDIYAESYNQAPEFFAFYRSLEAYRNTFNDKSDILVLKPDSEFFKFFKNVEKEK